MPWHIAKSAECPAGKPWAVIKDSDGSVAGCHPTEEKAKAQLAALYSSEANARWGGIQEYLQEVFGGIHKEA